MAALFDHPADAREAVEASRLASHEREALEVRHDRVQQLAGRSRFELERAIRTRVADRATSEVRLQIREKYLVPLIERQRERGPDFEPQSHLRSNLEGDAEASLSFDQASHEPRIQRGCSIGVPVCDEGRRIARRIVAASLSFRISRYGVTRTSLGITRCRIGREGFPDMSRFSATPCGAAGQESIFLTRQGISLP